MKICLISEGESIHTQRWTASLAKAGCNIHLISSSKANIPDVKIYNQKIYSRNPIQQIINNYRTKRLIAEINPDIIHLFGLFSVSSLGTMGLVNNRNNLVITVWGSDVISPGNNESYKERFIKSYLLNKGNCVLVASEYLADKTRLYLKQKRKIEILPWGVDLNIFRPDRKKNESESVTIGFTKRLHPLAGPDILLKAFKYACDHCNKTLQLKIAGDGPLKQKLIEMAAELELEDSIDWVGWLESPQSLSEFYRSLDLFLMPSRMESFGVSAVEASASALPVVASNFGGIPEIVEHGKTGLLVEPGNSKKFGSAISLLVADKNLRCRMGQKGRELVKKKYDWKNTIASQIKFYEKNIK